MAKKKATRKKQQEEPLEQAAEQAAEPSVEEAPSEATSSGDAGQLATLEEELASAREEAGKNWDLYLRSQAEMENFRKRMQRDKQESLRFANENILREILPVLDNLERAVDHARENEGDAAGLLEGVEMTLGQFASTLEKFGVKPVDAVGQPFDPACHEAMGQVETAEVPANCVAQQLQKGYLLNERLLRPALVMVATAPAVPADEAAEEEKTDSED